MFQRTLQPAMERDLYVYYGPVDTMCREIMCFDFRSKALIAKHLPIDGHSLGLWRKQCCQLSSQSVHLCAHAEQLSVCTAERMVNPSLALHIVSILLLIGYINKWGSPFSPGRRRPPGRRKLSPLCSKSTCGKR